MKNAVFILLIVTNIALSQQNNQIVANLDTLTAFIVKLHVNNNNFIGIQLPIASSQTFEKITNETQKLLEKATDKELKSSASEYLNFCQSTIEKLQNFYKTSPKTCEQKIQKLDSVQIFIREILDYYEQFYTFTVNKKYQSGSQTYWNLTEALKALLYYVQVYEALLPLRTLIDTIENKTNTADIPQINNLKTQIDTILAQTKEKVSELIPYNYNPILPYLSMRQQQSLLKIKYLLNLLQNTLSEENGKEKETKIIDIQGQIKTEVFGWHKNWQYYTKSYFKHNILKKL